MSRSRCCNTGGQGVVGQPQGTARSRWTGGSRRPTQIGEYMATTTKGKEDTFVLQGTVAEALPSGTYRVALDKGHNVLDHLPGKMRTHRIRVLPGDRVQVEISPYDLTRGRIKYRYK